MTVTLNLDAGMATITIDDGKVNALGDITITELSAALAEAGDARAVVITGRPGFLTAGLDVRAIGEMAPAGRREFFGRFNRLLLDLWLLPRPVVCAATGHAVAAGTLLALASDHTIAARGDFRWGLTEGRIGLELSDFSIALARSRVGAEHLDRLLLEGQVVDPDRAVAVGYATEVAEPDEVVARAVAAAEQLAALPPAAYARNKMRLRGATAAAARARLDDDIAALSAVDLA